MSLVISGEMRYPFGMGKKAKKPKKKRAKWSYVQPSRKKTQGKGSFDDNLIELKRLLVESKDLSDPRDFFDDHLLMSSDLYDLGVPKPNEKLEMALKEMIGAAISGASLESFMTINLSDHGFWHGPLQGEKANGLFFYYEDIDMGLVMVSDMQPGSLTHMLRFSIIKPTTDKVFWGGRRGSA